MKTRRSDYTLYAIRSTLNKGFTLIELLTGLLLFSIVIASLYTSFTLAIRAWKREKRTFVTHMRVSQVLQHMESNIFSLCKATPVPLVGKAQELYFPVYCYHEKSGTIEQVRFRLEKSGRQYALVEHRRSWSDWQYRDYDTWDKRTLLTDVVDIQFRYFGKQNTSMEEKSTPEDEEEQTSQWLEEWQEGTLPSYIETTITMAGPNDTEPIQHKELLMLNPQVE